MLDPTKPPPDCNWCGGEREWNAGFNGFFGITSLVPVCLFCGHIDLNSMVDLEKYKKTTDPSKED